MKTNLTGKRDKPGVCKSCDGLGVVVYDGLYDDGIEAIDCYDCIQNRICPECGGDLIYMTYNSELELVPKGGTVDDSDEEPEEVCEKCGLIWDGDLRHINMGLLAERMEV